MHAQMDRLAPRPWSVAGDASCNRSGMRGKVGDNNRPPPPGGLAMSVVGLLRECLTEYEMKGRGPAGFPDRPLTPKQAAKIVDVLCLFYGGGVFHMPISDHLGIGVLGFVERCGPSLSGVHYCS